MVLCGATNSYTRKNISNTVSQIPISAMQYQHCKVFLEISTQEMYVLVTSYIENSLFSKSCERL